MSIRNVGSQLYYAKRRLWIVSVMLAVSVALNVVGIVTRLGVGF